MNLPQSRNKDIDFVKGVLIFLVVLGHSLEVFQTQDFSTNSIHTAIYSFHMPMFVFLSGLFGRSNLQLDFISLLKKKFNQLLYPAIIFWCIDCGIIVGTRHLLATYKTGCDNILSFYWFFKMLFACIFISYFSDRISRKYKFVGCITTFALLVLLLRFDKYYDIIFYYPFYCFALYYGRKVTQRITNAISTISPWVIVLFFVAYNGLVITNFTWSDTVYVHNINIYTIKEAVQSAYTFLISISSLFVYFVFFLFLAQKCQVSKTLHQFISDTGKYTLQIYVIHIIIMHSCLRLFISTDSNLLTIIIAIVIYVMAYYISKCLSSNKYTNYLFRFDSN